jgi:tripartite-type tricarboxylate transporter receptor subunit TctC
MNKRRALKLIALASLYVAAGTALAQGLTGDKPIRLVVPLAGGSNPDALARVLAEQLRIRLGQTVVVENKPGANGSIAASYVLSQPADGTTLFLAGVSTLSWNPYLYKKLVYAPARDFTGVALVANTPFILVASPSLNVNSFVELVKEAKKEPGKFNYASSGIGNSTHLAMELISKRAGIKMVHVPFNGPTSFTSTISGDTQVMVTTLGNSTELIRSGKLKPLAATGDRRLPNFPDVPTFKELGFDVQVPGWFSIVAKSGTPAPVIERLNAEINKIIESPEMKAKLAAQSLDPLKGTPADVGRYMKRDAEQWGPLIKELNIEQ